MNDHELLERLAADAPVPGPGYAGHVLSKARRARSRRRVAELAAAVSVVALSVVGTTIVVQAADGELPSAPPASTGPTGTGRPTAPEAAAYAVAVRSLADQVREGGPPWRVLYVLDHTCANVVTPATGDCVPRPLPRSLQADIAEGLAPYAPVEFVTDREKVTDPQLTVVNEGVVVTLGRIRLQDDRAQVPLSVQRAGKNGRGLTFRLSRHGDAWRVDGTVGTMWIS